jgi:hypothetical protein
VPDGSSLSAPTDEAEEGDGDTVVSFDVPAVAEGGAEADGTDAAGDAGDCVDVAVAGGRVGVAGGDVAVGATIVGAAVDAGSAVSAGGGEVGGGVEGGTDVSVGMAIVGIAVGSSEVAVAPEGVGVRVGTVCRWRFCPGVAQLTRASDASRTAPVLRSASAS